MHRCPHTCTQDLHPGRMWSIVDIVPFSSAVRKPCTEGCSDMQTCMLARATANAHKTTDWCRLRISARLWLCACALMLTLILPPTTWDSHNKASADQMRTQLKAGSREQKESWMSYCARVPIALLGLRAPPQPALVASSSTAVRPLQPADTLPHGTTQQRPPGEGRTSWIVIDS